jgi:hypothetical protein
MLTMTVAFCLPLVIILWVRALKHITFANGLLSTDYRADTKCVADLVSGWESLSTQAAPTVSNTEDKG